MMSVINDTVFINAINTCKDSIRQERRNGRGGTAQPGQKALEVCPDITARLCKGVKTIMVCGTNGKTSTCRMISAFLAECGIDPVANRAGSNNFNGITVAFIEKTDANGNLTTDTALIECDELYVEETAGILKPDCVVFTNLSEDQQYRLDFSKVEKSLVNGLSKVPDAVVCINKGDEKLLTLCGKIPNPVVFYEIRDEIMILGTKSYSLPLKEMRREYRYDAAAACMAAKTFHIWNDDYQKILRKTKMPFARMEKFEIGKSRITMELMKNKASFDGVREYLSESHLYNVLITATDDKRELTWMKQADFSQISAAFEKKYVWGENEGAAYLRTEMNAEGIDYPGIIRFCQETNSNVFLLTEYYAMMKIRKRLCSDGYVPPMWEV